MSQDEIKKLVDELREKIKKVVDEGKILGLSIAVLNKEENIWLESFGYTDASKTQKVNKDTLFSLQSTTKTVTAVAFFLAEQKGLVKLDDPVVKHYPELYLKSPYGEEEYKKITFRHLLSHTSGLPREAKVGGCFSRTIPTWEEHIASLNGSWLQSPVGTNFSYSNAGMNLVTYILEKITGKPYPEYVQEVLGKPLGISYQWDIDEIYSKSNAAKGYLNGFEAHKLDGVAFGCGGAFISIEDQATFVKFLLNKGSLNGKSILEAKYFDLLRKTHDGNGGYGLATEVIVKFGIHVTKHVGGGFGLGSEMIWLPEYNIGVAHINNGEYESYYQLTSVILEFIKEYLELKGVDTQSTDFPHAEDPKIEVDSEKLKRLEGSYKGGFLTFDIEESDGKLFYVVSSNKVELTPHSEIAFTTKTPHGIVFDIDEKGKVVGSKLYHSSDGLIYGHYTEKTESKKLPPTIEEWKKYVGLYYSQYYYTEYNFSAISLDDDGYLQLGTSRLLPLESETNVFQSKNGKIVVFDSNSFIHDNIEFTRMDNVLEFYQKIAANEPKHRALVDYMIDGAITALKQLNKNKEAKELEKIKKK
ncbi:MAG: serine hydrolase [Candidatus Heimdallarchaeota archaeon]|nr:serine hydrolase [Candidatus Heimdallarchaeota archaeon]MBY8994813.1 serine hydrolase [Candidatus Heimdallarchaeota archaeon]